MKSNSFTKKEFVFVFMISLALGLRQMSMTMVMPFISTYSKTLAYSTPFLAGLALGAFGIAQAIFQIPFGILSDKFGNKLMILVGLMLVSIGLVVAFLASNIYVLILGRGLQGSGAVIGVAYSWVSSETHKENRMKALSIVGIFVSAAAAISFALGPMIHKFLKVDKMFLVSSVLIFIIWMYILLFLKDSSKSIQGKSSSSKENFTALMKNKEFVLLNSIAFINNFIMMSVFYFLPIYIQKIVGQDEMWKIFFPAVAIAIILMKIAVKYVERGKEFFITILSFIIILSGICFYFNNSNFWFLLIGSTMFMTGYICLSTVIATSANNLAEEENRGIANGIYNSFQYVGNFLGAIVTGALWGFSEKLILIIMIISSVIGILIIVYEKYNKGESGI